MGGRSEIVLINYSLQIGQNDSVMTFYDRANQIDSIPELISIYCLVISVVSKVGHIFQNILPEPFWLHVYAPAQYSAKLAMQKYM